MQIKNLPIKNLRTIILIPTLLQVFLVFGLISWFSFYSGQKSLKSLILKLGVLTVNSLEKEINGDLHGYLQRSPIAVDTFAHLIEGKGKLYGLNTKKNLNDKLPEIQTLFSSYYNVQSDAIPSIALGTQEGNYLEMRKNEQGKIYLNILDKKINKNRFDYIIDVENHQKTLVKSFPYDPRKRLWYQAAVKEGKPIWSPVYFSLSNPGLAISTTYPLYNNKHQITGVLASEISLSKLSSVLKNFQEPFKLGQIFIIDYSGNLIATASDNLPFSDKLLSRINVINSDNPLIKAAGKALLEKIGDPNKLDFDTIKKFQPLLFDFQGQKQIIGISPLGNINNSLVVLVIPQATFIDQMDTNTRLTILVDIIGLILAIWISLIISQWLVKPIKNLIVASDEIASGKFDNRVTVTRQDEIGTLAKTFNKMAENLENFYNEISTKNQDLLEAHIKLKEINQTLEEKIKERTLELEKSRENAEKARAKAEDANNLKSTFLANMSHELRTPLNAIIGYSEMLQEEAEDIGEQEFVSDLKKIQGAGKHLLGLINDVLDLSKIEAGRMDLYLETFEISPLIQEIINTIIPLLDNNNNQLVPNLSDNLGLLYADITKVRQSLLNLLSNASKFTEEGTITLTVNRYTDQAGEWLEFKVQDTGIGMSPEQKEKVFQAFTQADASTTRKYGGTGLGLAITKKFCEMMGGSILVDSELGKGSTFTMKLPSKVVKPKESVSLPNQPNITPVISQSINNNILVIDDDPAIHDLMTYNLEKEGFQVITATNGEEGLSLAKQHLPRAIILDVIMPKMDGWEVLNSLKNDVELASIPVIMATVVDNKNLAYTLGASGYLTKPINAEQLKNVLNNYQLHPSSNDILVVEDDETTRSLMRRLLEKGGYQVREANNGLMALENLKIQVPNLIILDLMMPEMNGFEFLFHLRQNPQWHNLPVIVMTAKDLTEDERNLLQTTVENVLQKGAYQTQNLLGLIRSTIQQ